ncbi:MAG: Transporter [Rhodospirillales bacterium]|nr:Transporter [Rhodospirillales bacterium]
MGAQWTRFGAGGMLAASLIACAPAFAQPADGPLGATADGLIAAGRQLSPALRAAALETAAVSAKAEGADALDDPTISDSYQYYKDPGVFSAHTVMVTQAFPLWGKRDLRREAALADVDAARGQEQAAQDELDDKIKLAFAQYYLVSRAMSVNREIADLAHRIRSAAAARYGQGGGDQTAVIQASGEETAAKTEAIRLEGERDAARARLNALVGRPNDAPLTEPLKARPMPAAEPIVAGLVDRARAANPTLAAGTAAIAAAKSRSSLADKAWLPDVTVGGGPLIQTNNRPVGFAATIGFNIPLSWGREASGQHEAAVRVGETQQRYEVSLREVEGALGEAVAKLRAARATEELLRHEAMPQARATFQTVLANYSQGKGDLAAAITAEHQIHEVDLRLLQTRFEEQAELAAIERLIGGDL